LQDAGAAALAIHGRTYTQKYGGSADWNPIYELKKHLSIPVIGNGDITSGHNALEKIGNLDGVMIGRGSLGNPWVFREVIDALKSGSAQTIIERSFEEKIAIMLRHSELAAKHKGEPRGILEMRKHYVNYVRGFDGAKEMRQKLMDAETIDDVKAILQS